MVAENVFENRFSHLSCLSDMGAKIRVLGNVALIEGVKRLKGAEVVANDLRAGASLVLAGLSAKGQTLVHGVQHVERGYLDFHKKLEILGANIKLIDC